MNSVWRWAGLPARAVLAVVAVAFLAPAFCIFKLVAPHFPARSFQIDEVLDFIWYGLED